MALVILNRSSAILRADKASWTSAGKAAPVGKINYRLARAIAEAALKIRAQELAAELETMRQESSLHGDLRKLIFIWKHHHERSDSSTGWEALAGKLTLYGGADKAG